MKKKDEMGNRLKAYEEKSRIYLDVNLPIFVRVDGKAFHTWVGKNKFKRPFDWALSTAMGIAAVETCKEIGSVAMAYSQSDEATFLMGGGVWGGEKSQVWFGGNIQKVSSVIASIFTANFNSVIALPNSLAYFDCRVFNVPLNEVENIFIWRQFDAKRNSIQSLAHSMFSQKVLLNKNSDELREMCELKGKGEKWEELPSAQKWGFTVKKYMYEIVTEDGQKVLRSKWVLDNDVPFFADNRDYLKNIIYKKDGELVE